MMNGGSCKGSAFFFRQKALEFKSDAVSTFPFCAHDLSQLVYRLPFIHMVARLDLP